MKGSNQMHEVTINGVPLVQMKYRPDWLKVYCPTDSCEGCYFDTSDSVNVVAEHLLPSKRVNPGWRSCERPKSNLIINGAHGCFFTTKDYYERFKPK